jgi:hypothetical protein
LLFKTYDSGTIRKRLYIFTQSNTAFEESSLSEERETQQPLMHEGLFFAVIVVFFFSLVSWFFATTPNLNTDISAFFQGFTLVQVPNTAYLLPAPVTPGAYPTIYAVAARWCLIWGGFEIFLLILRFGVRSSYWRKVETFTTIIWWFGAYYLINMFLSAATTLVVWFAFWGAIIMLIGAQLVIRGIILAAITRLK